jgi:hypothetical protein
LAFFWLIWARLEAAWSSASKTCSEVLHLRFDDSRDLVFAGWTLEDVVSSAVARLLLEDLRGALEGAAEQLATTTAEYLVCDPGVESEKICPRKLQRTHDLSSSCASPKLYMLCTHSWHIRQPWGSLSFRFQAWKSALWPSLSWMPNFGKGTSCAAQLTLKFTIWVGAQP